MISICIPVYEQNGMGRNYLLQLFQSIAIQTYRDFEVIVSDNSRDDVIQNACAQYWHFPIRYFRNNESFGVSNNTNNALDKARGEHVKIMYSDDLFLTAGALELFVRALHASAWAVSDNQTLDQSGYRQRHINKAGWNSDLIKGNNTLGMPSVMAMVRNELRFDSNLTTLLDCEFYYRMHKLYGEPVYIHQPLIGQRYWPGSMSLTEPNHKAEDFEYIKQKHPELSL